MIHPIVTAVLIVCHVGWSVGQSVLGPHPNLMI